MLKFLLQEVTPATLLMQPLIVLTATLASLKAQLLAPVTATVTLILLPASATLRTRASALHSKLAVPLLVITMAATPA
jgi:hypothetical protein